MGEVLSPLPSVATKRATRSQLRRISSGESVSCGLRRSSSAREQAEVVMRRLLEAIEQVRAVALALIVPVALVVPVLMALAVIVVVIVVVAMVVVPVMPVVAGIGRRLGFDDAEGELARRARASRVGRGHAQRVGAAVGESGAALKLALAGSKLSHAGRAAPSASVAA